ncbi:MAG: leucine-rich repeat domain-containing protein, partial [Ruminococcus sp.]|nr:leucine-rich repeat domain-containing protein [Ruminococcus sp.]
NGEYGTWPTKELLAEHTGITFDGNGSPVLPEGSDMVVDDYGTINRVVTTRDGIQQKLMVAGNFTGKYYSDIPTPDVPSTGGNSTPYEPSTCSVTTTPYEHPVGGKIYFEVNPDLWKYFKTVTMYLYPHGESALITWGSKKGNMTNEGNNIWSFDFNAKGIELDSGKQYGIIFTGDWNVQTCDIIFDTSIMGDTAYCTGDLVENSVDSNKRSYDVRWKNADPEKYAPPVCITAIGNIIGNAYWAGTTPYDMLVNFIKSDGVDGLANALRYNGKTAQQTLDDISDRWGLSSDDVEKAIRESGKTVDWDNSNSGSSSSGSSSSGTAAWSNLLSFTVKVDGTLELTNCSGKIDEVPAVYPENIRYSVNNPFATGNEVIDYKNTPVTSIGDWAFANNKYVETVEIPDSIKKIGKGAFYNCVKLQSITIPEGVTALSANTFEKCLYLEEVNLGSKLKSIGDEAFYDCRRLRTLDIPASVTEIGEEAFTNCRSLTNLTIPDGVKKLGDENSVGYGMFE